MKCREAKQILSAALDGQTAAAELRELRRHLDSCSSCALDSYQASRLRSTLRSMPRLEPPQELAARLRVAASQRCAELVRQATLRGELRYWLDIARVWSDNLMRPFALPVAGGLVSAVFLFMMVVPMYGVRASSPADDVPTSLTTVATLRGSTYSFGVEHSDIVVDVLIDKQGRMIDYSAPAGQDWQLDPKIRRSVENALLCTQFNPATLFGQPKSGKLRITFRRNEVEVKG